ncbi:MAG: GTP 3',8-cyclase MoaA [Lachnospiraceae bacterium]|nr:GTP 3',8-cyclase MoaA [Lachnospiraceae bacterium]
MKDSYNRNIDYLRISLTDRCNLRCKYCMPQEGVEHVSHNDILSLEEISRIVSILAKLGIKRIRLTGGEPLIRKNICKLIRDIKNTEGIERVSITTNGTMLKYSIDELVKAGLDDINISLDTLSRDVFNELTGEDKLEDVLEGIELAIKYNLKPKINCVPIKEWNEKEISDIAGMAKDKNIDVRFIELMPTSCGKNYCGIENGEIKKNLESVFGELKEEVKRELCRDEAQKEEQREKQNGPAIYYRPEGFKGRIGFISPISNVFCASCNRIRLTSTGTLKMCLHHDIGVDIREKLRNNSTDSEITEIIRESISLKPKEHQMMREAEYTDMFQIGG